MKRIICALLAILLLAGCSCALAQEQQVKAYWQSEDGREIAFEDLMENGVVMLQQDSLGYTRVEYHPVNPGGYYTVRLLGTAVNGADFNAITPLPRGYGYTSEWYSAAQHPGTYGPYRLQILGENCIQEYDVAFEVTQEAEYGGFADRGQGIYAHFALYQKGTPRTLGGMDITYPDGSYALSGAPGYEIGLGINRGETLPDPIHFQMLDAETDELIFEEDLVMNEWYKDKVEIYTDVIIPTFESGRKYRFVITSGDLFGSQEYVLLDETAGQTAGNPDEIRLMSCHTTDYDAEPVPFEDLMQEDGLVHLTTDMQGQLCLQSEVASDQPVLRMNWIGKNMFGQSIDAPYSIETDGRGIVTFSFNPGVYEPVTLRVQSGAAVKEYQLSVTVPEGVDTHYAGVMDYESSGQSFMPRWDMEQEKQAPSAVDEIAVFSQNMNGDGAVYVGQTDFSLDVYADVTNVSPGLEVRLYDTETDGCIAKEELWFDGKYEGRRGNGSASNSLRIAGFDSGRTYRLALVSEGDALLDQMHVVLISEDELFARVRPAPLEATLYQGDRLPALVEQTIAEMSTAQLGSSEGFWQHRYAAPSLDSGIVAASFDVHDPVVSLVSAQNELQDLASSANWALYDQYLAQFRDGYRFPDMQPVNLEELDAQFAEGWQDMLSFDFAQAVARGEDGADYFFAPVYFTSEEGGILHDLVYLYVFVVRDGMNRAPIDVQEDFIWIDTGENLCNTHHVMITDQAAVAEILRELRQQTGDWPMPDVSGYTDWYDGMESRAVRSVQLELKQRGYLEEPADGIYGDSTRAALKAFQKASKLKTTGKADPKTLEALYSDGDTRDLLRTWLDAR